MQTKQRVEALAKEKLGPNVVLSVGKPFGLRANLKLVGMRQGDTVTYLACGNTWHSAFLKAWNKIRGTRIEGFDE